MPYPPAPRPPCHPPHCRTVLSPHAMYPHGPPCHVSPRPPGLAHPVGVPEAYSSFQQDEGQWWKGGCPYLAYWCHDVHTALTHTDRGYCYDPSRCLGFGARPHGGPASPSLRPGPARPRIRIRVHWPQIWIRNQCPRIRNQYPRIRNQCPRIRVRVHV